MEHGKEFRMIFDLNYFCLISFAAVDQDKLRTLH